MAPTPHRTGGRSLRVLSLAPVLLLGSTVLLAGPSPPTPPVVRTRLALDHLAASAIAWQNQFQCSGCHKQPMTLAALAMARSSGHDAPVPGTLPALVAGTLNGTSGQDAQGCFSFGGSHGFTMATTFAARGLEAYDRYLGAELRTNLRSAADCLLGKQAADGRLPADSAEFPVSQGDFVTTAHGAFAWARAFERDRTVAYQNAANQAVAWLRSRVPAIEAAPASFTTQDKAMLLAGLGSAGAGPADPDVQRMRVVLAADQLLDGSWKIQSSTAGGNAHATGQVVFALRAIGSGLEDPALAAGRQSLLTAQEVDGSWLAVHWVGGTPSQVAPSMWATLALATFPSPLVTLRVTGDTIEWQPVEGAERYDLIRGSLSGLTTAAQSVELGAVDCVASAEPGTSFEDPAVPPSGDGFFYLFRIRWGGNADGYGRASDGRERLPLVGDCGP